MPTSPNNAEKAGTATKKGIAMKTATLAQGSQVLNLILQKKFSTEQLQNLLESGLLSDLFDGNIGEVNRKEFRRMMGLNPLTVRHIIDLDAPGFIPKGWKELSHRRGGMLEWNPDKAKLYLSRGQKVEQGIAGRKLAEELKVMQGVMNANVLDYLFVHQELIPDSWKELGEDGCAPNIFFWGTIYGNAHNPFSVRYLQFYGEKWRQDARSLGSSWDANDPAGVMEMEVG